MYIILRACEFFIFNFIFRKPVRRGNETSDDQIASDYYRLNSLLSVFKYFKKKKNWFDSSRRSLGTNEQKFKYMNAFLRLSGTLERQWTVQGQIARTRTIEQCQMCSADFYDIIEVFENSTCIFSWIKLKKEKNDRWNWYIWRVADFSEWFW